MKKKLKIFAATFLIIITGVWWLVQLPSPLFKPDYSTVVLDENGKFLRVFINEREQWALPPDGDKIPDKLKEAVLNYEDKRFYDHHGIDPLALVRAFYQNLREMDKISGASTITMQVARLTRPKARTIVNKLIEMVQALKIERKYSKEEILKSYLTHAPYGGNIIGYQTASYRYFGKNPAEMTWGEAATLAVLPNSPGLINPVQDSKKLKEKRNRLLKKLFSLEIIDEHTYQLAVTEPIPDKQLPFALSAPHLAEKLKSVSKQKIIKTTISRNLQQQVNRIAGEYMEMMKERGAYNCAILLASSETGEVKAYLGSHDYYDKIHSGQINGVEMARSTGSILKPFLYGLAMDEGLIIPQSKIKDIPISYGAYTPYNYSGGFDGVVTAREALIRSLNAPAVNLLDEYGIERFYSFLKKVGLTTLFRTPEEYGLPLILGGAEASLWDAASLYYGLANYGYFDRLHVIKDDEKNTGKRLISQGSAYLVLDILKDLNRPGVEYFWQEYASNWKIAWKTGTSYGNRDSWAVGITPQWVIAVWVGNFDGSESQVLTGLGAAAPLLFRIFNSLEKDSYRSWFNRPIDLKKIRVSVNTGYRLKGYPEKTVEIDAPVSARPLRYSPFERVIYLSGDGSEEVCSLCWDRGDIKEVLKVVYPPEVIEYLKEMGNAFYTIPPHRKSCPTVSPENPIRFIYPQEGSKILIPRGIEGEYQKVKIKVAHSHHESKLFWYLDDNYLGETVEFHQQARVLSTGRHKLHVVDDEGHHREIVFYVETRG